MKNLENILFIVFFFIFIAAFSGQSAHQTHQASSYGLTTEFHSNHAKAIVVNGIQFSSLQKGCLTLLYNTNPSLFNENFKIFADNRNITRRIIILHQTQLKIKPMIMCRFYFHLLSADTEELPILS